MATFLLKVEGRFTISGRGLVITPGLGDKVKFVNTGTCIKLVRPDRSEIETRVVGIALGGTHDIMIPLEIQKDEVPIGTEVWTAE